MNSPGQEITPINGSRSQAAAVSIAIAEEFTTEVFEGVKRLLPQLSTCPVPSAVELQEIIAADETILLLARSEGEMVGMLTLVVFRIPTGMRAWIEDVVVDSSARGKGVGEFLVQEAINVARTCGAKTVDLTSRPSREAANRLYQKVGFQRRETNLYRVTT